ncbi:MAG TPA: type II CRISPR-associated endonuclease Cas1 [Oscillospiraceae bacterium]|nr:type II CRISPR-associated endonuclease Cas1 [Oscillospiraceae bacterium]
MSFRTVVIKKQCKCSYKNGYLVVRDDETTLVHLSEVYCLVFDTTAISVTAYLLNELCKRKIPLIICDEQHNPSGEILPIYGCHNTSKRIAIQTAWKENSKEAVWTAIVREKISQQSKHLKKLNMNEFMLLEEYIDQLEFFDKSNREGHAAKVYFHALFGKDFSRDDDSYINAALNYGYGIILSTFNREIVSNGYLTQIGIRHKNEFNEFNLSCDLMEPFRIVVDRFVTKNHPFVFDEEIRFGLVDLLNEKVLFDEGQYYLSSAIGLYVKSVFAAIQTCECERIKFYDFL